MKVFLFPLLALVVGTSLGIGHTAYEFSSQPSRFEVGGYNIHADYAPIKNDAAEGDARVLVVNGETHDFGEMDMNKKYQHAFILKNTGDVPLAVEVLATSCKCTVADLPTGDVEPGKTVEVVLEWTPKQMQGSFSHSAQIATSDEDRSVIVLRVKGAVKKPFDIHPFDFYFGDLSSNEAREATVQVLSFENEDLEYKGYKFTDPKTSEFYEAKVRLLDEEELAAKNAKSGMQVTLNVKPGLPAGHITQSIQIDTNIQDDGGVVIPITGKVVGDVLFLGHPRLNREISLLTIGVVKKGKSAQHTVFLSIRGSQREAVQLSVDQEEVSPSDVIQASIGEPRSQGRTKVFPLTIKISADSPAANLYGPRKEAYGKIPIRTTLPNEQMIELLVKVIVER